MVLFPVLAETAQNNLGAKLVVESGIDAFKSLFCGARTRAGGTCRGKPIRGKCRCANYGGLSTGPKTGGGKKIYPKRKKGDGRTIEPIKSDL